MTEKETFTGIAMIDRRLTEAESQRDHHGHFTRKIFLMQTERYLFDVHLDKGWLQFDTASDASYFGIWVNKTRLQVLQFIEGDLYWTGCESADDYDSLIAHLCSFYENAPAFTTIDKNVVTRYFTDRSVFFIDPSKAPPFDT